MEQAIASEVDESVVAPLRFTVNDGKPVIAELDRALNDHELIKVKLAVGSREARGAVAREVCDQTGAELVHSIGNMIVILRRVAQPDPRLSNLVRPL